MLDGPHGRFGRVQKISLSLGFDIRTTQPVASCYPDRAIAVHTKIVGPLFLCLGNGMSVLCICQCGTFRLTSVADMTTQVAAVEWRTSRSLSAVWTLIADDSTCHWKHISCCLISNLTKLTPNRRIYNSEMIGRFCCRLFFLLLKDISSLIYNNTQS